MITELIAGALLAAVFVVVVRRLGPAEERIYALGLFVAAVIYVGFAVIGAAEQRWTAIELVGVLPFAGFAWLGLRYSPWWLVAGWGMHAAWDSGLHLISGTPAFVPDWYPVVCLGFDLFVAGVIVSRIRAHKLLSANAA